MLKTIANNEEYKEALKLLEKYFDADPEKDPEGAETAKILSLIIKDYEGKKFKLLPPTPLEAIQFRMEQQNLEPRDLIPYIGSRSKVSEVLSGKRPLSLQMVRSLSENLGIPADILIQESSSVSEDEIEWNNFPIKEVQKRSWVPDSLEKGADDFLEMFKSYMYKTLKGYSLGVLYRKTEHERAGRESDKYALAAWTNRIIDLSTKEDLPSPYSPGTVNKEFMIELAKLSWSDMGPILAKEYLNKHGIHFFVEPHLKKSYLDGAAIMADKNRPIVALTLRYDRLDNFWFCLMHELAHICLHFEKSFSQFYDDLDVESNDPLEEEADSLAQEALIPSEEWDNSPAKKLRSPEAVFHLAKRLHIHPSIVAGRMRHHFKTFRLFNNLVGSGQVRKHFGEEKWEK